MWLLQVVVTQIHVRMLHAMMDKVVKMEYVKMIQNQIQALYSLVHLVAQLLMATPI